MTSWLKPSILLGVVLLLVFHPQAQAAAGLCLFVSLGGWFLEGSLLAGHGATWTSMGRALTGAGTLPFYALLLLGSSTLGFTRADHRFTPAFAAQASASGEAGYRSVAAKAKAPEGGCSSGSGCGSAGGCGTGGCGAASGGACGCGSGAAKKTVAAIPSSTSTTPPPPVVSKQRSAPMPGLMVPIQTPNRGTQSAPSANVARQPSPSILQRPQIIRPPSQGLTQVAVGTDRGAAGVAAAQSAPSPSAPPMPQAPVFGPIATPISSRVLPPATSPATPPAVATVAPPSAVPPAPPPAISTDPRPPSANNK